MSRMIEMGNEISESEYLDALALQPSYQHRFDEVFKSFDFLMTPSTASVAPKVGEQEQDDTCLIWTFLGYPALSLPVFWEDTCNLPFGVQLIAPRSCDFPLLDLGEQLAAQLG